MTWQQTTSQDSASDEAVAYAKTPVDLIAKQLGIVKWTVTAATNVNEVSVPLARPVHRISEKLDWKS